MTLGDLIRHVSLTAGLDDTAGSDEYTLMVDWANEGVIEVLKKTRCYQIEGQSAMTSGEDHFTADASILLVLDWQFPDLTDYDRLSVDEVRDLRRLGSSRKAYAMEFRDFWMNPAATTGFTVSFTFVPYPTAMSSASHDPSNVLYGGVPAQYHTAIRYYMLWQSALYDEKKLPLSPKDYRELFQDECKNVRVEGLRQGGRRVGRMRVGYPSATQSTRRNDVYP